MNTLENTKVTIIVPARNVEAYIGQTITSILTQNYSYFELFIIDDGSTDRTREIVESFKDKRITVFNGPKCGIAAAFNLGLLCATGEIVMRCDGDDAFAPGRIAAQVGFLKDNPYVDAVCGNYDIIDSHGKEIFKCEENLPRRDVTDDILAHREHSHVCTFAIRTELLRETLKGFRPAFKNGEDIDLILRLAEETRIQFMPGLMYYYRIHNGSISHTQTNTQRKFYCDLAYRCHDERRKGLIDAIDRQEQFDVPDFGGVFSAESHAQSHMLGQAWKYHREGRRLKAIVHGVKALFVARPNVRMVNSVAMLFVKAIV